MLSVRRFAGELAVCVVAFVAGQSALGAGFAQTNLVSNQAGGAQVQDTNLVNSWGLTSSPTSPFWSANNGTGTATVYTSTSATSVSVNSLVVTTPMTNPITGMVFNANTSSFHGDAFIFTGEDGGVYGWRGALGTMAETGATTPGASYKGVAIANNGSDHLYGADFAHNSINVFDSTFAGTTLAGTFTDPNLPAGYAPFNVRAFGSQLFVTYAVRDPASGDDMAGPGNGIVSVFDFNGNFLRRLVTGGHLNSPWGLEMAPAGFGLFGGDLLVGNFGDGTINAYDPTTGTFAGTLSDNSNNPLTIDGLWALKFGNGGNGGASGVLYFTSGPNDEADGLFGSIASVPEPGTLALLGMALALVRKRRGAAA